jgi:hypothetical protein
MRLDVGGHPLHTRALAVIFTQRADARLDAHGYVLDLRKRGMVPLADALQGPGLIHHMRVSARIDPATRTLETIAAEQPSVAFEPSAATGGESCRDPVDRLRALAGTALDTKYPRRLAAEIGGPGGCSHVVTLSQLLGSTAAWALTRDRERHGPAPARQPGERVFRRDLVVDGHDASDGRLVLAAQLTDLHFTTAPPHAGAMARLASQHEIRALATVDLPTMSLVQVTAAERVRGPEDLEHAAWRYRGDEVGALCGLRLAPGVSTALIERLGGVAADRPLLDALLMLAPAFTQCVAALSDAWLIQARGDPAFVIGAPDDSCYMYRRGGALARTRARAGR